MKKILYSLISVICILTMLVSMTVSTVFAENLYDKYKYDPNFVYDNERIGHALKSTVPKVYHYTELTVSYPVIVCNTSEIDRHIGYRQKGLAYKDMTDAEFQTLLKTNISEFLSKGSTETSEVSYFATGSGVVLSEDGYIATNAHVTEETSSEDIKYEIISEITLNTAERIKAQISSRIAFTPDDEYLLTNAIYDKIDSDTKIKDSSSSYEVAFASPDGKTALSDGIKYKAKLVEEGTSQGEAGLTQDGAILKVDATNLVALKLSDSYPESNSAITAAGFPSSSEVIFTAGNTVVSQSELTPTISDGTVARIASQKGEYNAIEVNVKISNGSSGGPSVDNTLNVEGLNTYGVPDDPRFAYMIPSQYLLHLTEDITLNNSGDVTKTFLTGLQMLQQQHGRAALECFEYVKNAQSNTPYIDHLISLAKAAPQTTPDEGEKKEKGFLDSVLDFIEDNVVLISCIGGALVLIIVTIIVVVVMKKKKKKASMEDGTAGEVFTDTPSPGPIVPPYPGAATPTTGFDSSHPFGATPPPSSSDSFTPPPSIHTPRASYDTKASEFATRVAPSKPPVYTPPVPPTPKPYTPPVPPASSTAYTPSAPKSYIPSVPPTPSAPYTPPTPPATPSSSGGSGLKLSKNLRDKE